MDAPSLPVLSVWTDADDSSRRLPGLEHRVPGCAATPSQALPRDLAVSQPGEAEAVLRRIRVSLPWRLTA